jgi:autotransporter-associated beta strand protein
MKFSIPALALLLALGTIPAQAITVDTSTDPANFGATTSSDDVDVLGAVNSTTTATANVNAGGSSPNSPSQTIQVGDSSIFTVGQSITTTPGLPDNTWVREITDGTTIRVEGPGLPWGYNKSYTVSSGYMFVKSADTLTSYKQVSAQGTADVNNLTLSGAGSAITLSGGSTLSIYGNLTRSSGSGAIGSISGGTGIQAGTLNANLTISTPLASDGLYISSPILANGTGGLTKTGAGTLMIAHSPNAGGYTGKTLIDGGRLSLYNPTNGNAEVALGVVPGSFEADNITLQNGAILQYSSLANNNQLTISANRGITLGAGTQTIERLGQDQLNLNSVISGTGGLFFDALMTNDAGGTGFAVLNAANTYSGDTTFGWGPVITTGSNQKGWSITLGNKDALQNSTVVWENANGYNENAGRPYKLVFNAGNETYTLGGLAGSKDADTARWTSLNNASKTVAIGNNDKDTTFTGKISWGATHLEKIGTGTLTLTNVNAFTGSTTITDGTLEISGSGSINATSGVTINGGNLRYNSSVAYSGAMAFTAGTLSGTNWTGALDAQTVGTGQTIAPGNSPGTANTGSQTWAGGGTYLWEVNDATGTAGADPGWDLVSGTGTLDITATSGSKFTLEVVSLLASNAPGDADNFNALSSYNWLIADFVNSVTGFDAANFDIDTAGFSNAFGGTFGVALGDTFGIGGDDSQVYLTYVGIPEPATALLGSLGLLVLLRRRRL